MAAFPPLVTIARAKNATPHNVQASDAEDDRAGMATAVMANTAT
jgi:hypothetical protein